MESPSRFFGYMIMIGLGVPFFHVPSRSARLILRVSSTSFKVKCFTDGFHDTPFRHFIMASQSASGSVISSFVFIRQNGGVSPVPGSAATGPKVCRIATLLFAFRQGFQFLVVCYLGYLHCVQTCCPLLHNRRDTVAPARVVVVDVAAGVDIPRVIRIATIR